MSVRRDKQFDSVFCCPHCFALAAVKRTLPSEALGVRSYTDGLVIGRRSLTPAHRPLRLLPPLLLVRRRRCSICLATL
ncbi:MAG: hypothetical protein IPP28_00435 [Xanthomonadales bacterium]|nr:hypothetical protein [Xanthomonadales bacterium]